MQNVDSSFESKDFYLVAICIATGCTLTSLKHQEGNFTTFVLAEPSSQCKTIIAKHWSGELMVSSRKIIDAINELKTRLHNGV